MNFYELFEASKEKEEQAKKAGEYQDVTIADPKAALALKQARARYTYADSDLEAFVKMTQDKEEEEDKEIEKLEKDTERQENEIKDLEAKERQTDKNIEKLEKENDLQDKHISKLSRMVDEFEKLADRYKTAILAFNDQLDDIEDRLSKMKGIETPPSSDYYHTARLAARDLEPPKSTE